MPLSSTKNPVFRSSMVQAVTLATAVWRTASKISHAGKCTPALEGKAKHFDQAVRAQRETALNPEINKY